MVAADTLFIFATPTGASELEDRPVAAATASATRETTPVPYDACRGVLVGSWVISEAH